MQVQRDPDLLQMDEQKKLRSRRMPRTWLVWTCRWLVAALALAFLLTCGWVLTALHDVLLCFASAACPGASKLVTEFVDAHCSDAHKSSFVPDDALLWAPMMRARWRDIRDELLAFEPKHGEMPLYSTIDPPSSSYLSPHWRTLQLRLLHQDLQVAALFPQTMGLLNRTDAVSAMFSSLPAGQGIKEHVGPSKLWLRYHLGLEVPPPSVGRSETSEPLLLHVADGSLSHSYTSFTWSNGSDLLFDDSSPHSVTNRRMTGRRVTLVVDVPRRDCGWLFNPIVGLALSPVALGRHPRAKELIRRANADFALSGLP